MFFILLKSHPKAGLASSPNLLLWGLLHSDVRLNINKGKKVKAFITWFKVPPSYPSYCWVPQPCAEMLHLLLWSCPPYFQSLTEDLQRRKERMWEGKSHWGLLYLSYIMKTSVHTEAFCVSGIILGLSSKLLAALGTNYSSFCKLLKCCIC